MKSNKKTPDDSVTQYDGKGQIAYHSTNGVEDTVSYLATQRITKQKEKYMEKLQSRPRIVRNLAQRTAFTDAFNNIALRIAKERSKKD